MTRDLLCVSLAGSVLGLVATLGESLEIPTPLVQCRDTDVCFCTWRRHQGEVVVVREGQGDAGSQGMKQLMTEVQLAREASFRGGEPCDRVMGGRRRGVCLLQKGYSLCFLSWNGNTISSLWLVVRICTNNNSMITDNSWCSVRAHCVMGTMPRASLPSPHTLISNTLWDRNHHQPRFSDGTN